MDSFDSSTSKKGKQVDLMDDMLNRVIHEFCQGF